MRVAERNAFSHQVVSQIGSQHVPAQSAPALLLQNLHRLDDAGNYFQRQPDVVKDEEHRLLVHLKVFVVRRRQSFERHDDAGELSENSARQSTNELKAVGVKLLRHQRRPGGVRAGQFNETKLFGVVQNQILG